jgi:hypothetical protein
MTHFRGYWLDRWNEIMCGEDIEAPDVDAAIEIMRQISQRRRLSAPVEIWQGANRLYNDPPLAEAPLPNDPVPGTGADPEGAGKGLAGLAGEPPGRILKDRTSDDWPGVDFARPTFTVDDLLARAFSNQEGTF